MTQIFGWCKSFKKLYDICLNWVVLLFNRANCVGLTLSCWWCFKTIYFFLMFKYNRDVWTYNIKFKKNECVFAQMNFGLCWLYFFHEKRQGHFRPAVCSWEGETNCLNVSSCETIRLQGCCQGCFWHLAKSLRAVILPWDELNIHKFQGNNLLGAKRLKCCIPSLIFETKSKEISIVSAWNTNILSMIRFVCDRKSLILMNTRSVNCPGKLFLVLLHVLRNLLM